MIFAKANGLKGDGVTDDYTALNTLLVSIGSVKKEIYLSSGTYIIGTNIIIPSNIKLIFANGAMLSANIGVTVTFNGVIEAGIYQVFTGAGTISGTPICREVYPEWFGAIGNAVANDAAPIQKAINMIGVNGGIVRFSSKIKPNQTLLYFYYTLTS